VGKCRELLKKISERFAGPDKGFSQLRAVYKVSASCGIPLGKGEFLRGLGRFNSDTDFFSGLVTLILKPGLSSDTQDRLLRGTEGEVR